MFHLSLRLKLWIKLTSPWITPSRPALPKPKSLRCLRVNLWEELWKLWRTTWRTTLGANDLTWLFFGKYTSSEYHSGLFRCMTRSQIWGTIELHCVGKNLTGSERKALGIRLRTSYVEGRWHQNWACNRPAKFLLQAAKEISEDLYFSEIAHRIQNRVRVQLNCAPDLTPCHIWIIWILFRYSKLQLGNSYL